MSTSPAQAPARAYTLAPNEGETINVVGDGIRILADAHATGGRCFIFECTTPPGGGPPVHRHGVDDEFFFILAGRYRFLLDGKTIEAQPGSFVSAPRGSLHAFTNIADTPGRMLIITSPAGLETPFRRTHEASTSGPLTPDKLGAIFEAFNLTIHGPPIGRG